MQKYLFVMPDGAFTRQYVEPDELKAAAKGKLQIFELDVINETVSKFNPDSDEFEEIPRKF